MFETSLLYQLTKTLLTILSILPSPNIQHLNFWAYTWPFMPTLKYHSEMLHLFQTIEFALLFNQRINILICLPPTSYHTADILFTTDACPQPHFYHKILLTLYPPAYFYQRGRIQTVPSTEVAYASARSWHIIWMTGVFVFSATLMIRGLIRGILFHVATYDGK